MRYFAFPGQTLALVLTLTLLTGCAALTGAGKAPETAPDLALDPDLIAVEDTPDEAATPAANTIPTGPQSTIAGLGDPGKPGLWLETPLVTAQGPGRIRLASGGGTVAVTLRPVPGEATAGSRLSLEAMRALGAPLTELVELTVTPGG